MRGPDTFHLAPEREREHPALVQPKQRQLDTGGARIDHEHGIHGQRLCAWPVMLGGTSREIYGTKVQLSHQKLTANIGASRGVRTLAGAVP
jgi:hypothetical protein